MDLHLFVFMKFAGADRLKTRNNTGLRKELSVPKTQIIFIFSYIAGQFFLLVFFVTLLSSI